MKKNKKTKWFKTTDMTGFSYNWAYFDDIFNNKESLISVLFSILNLFSYTSSLNLKIKIHNIIHECTTMVIFYSEHNNKIKGLFGIKFESFNRNKEKSLNSFLKVINKLKKIQKKFDEPGIKKLKKEIDRMNKRTDDRINKNYEKSK